MASAGVRWLLCGLVGVAAAVRPGLRTGVRRHASPSLRFQSDDERRDVLKQLFGEATAEARVPRKRETELPEVQMLQTGLQKLEWGGIRLIDVDLATGPLELTLEPLAKGTELVCVRLDMPLGMLLEEETPATFEALSSSDSLEGSALNEGEATPPVSRAFSPMPVVVAELFDGSAAKRGGVQVGDIVRACTFMSMAMSYPTWQLMMGGVGKPTLQKSLMPTDGVPFEQVLAAISSNSREMQGNGQVVLMLERSIGMQPID